MSYVYLLVSTNGNTYVGATKDLNRRLRQHNKEIKGGAHATGIKVSQGELWTRAAHISGFPDWQAALQFEWRWKQLSRKLSININPLERRITTNILSLDTEFRENYNMTNSNKATFILKNPLYLFTFLM